MEFTNGTGLSLYEFRNRVGDNSMGEVYRTYSTFNGGFGAVPDGRSVTRRGSVRAQREVGSVRRGRRVE